jgi:hypothetical protein
MWFDIIKNYSDSLRERLEFNEKSKEWLKDFTSEQLREMLKNKKAELETFGVYDYGTDKYKKLTMEIDAITVEIKRRQNPSTVISAGKGFKNPETYSLENPETHLYKKPPNYTKIKNITILLDRMNIKINRENILGELMGAPTNEDNKAIEYILGE